MLARRHFVHATLVALAALGATSCSSGGRASDGTAAGSSAITSGTADDADTSAVFIKATVKGQTGYCSGVVVSPHVVLTAGHCSTMDATYAIFVGPDFNDRAAQAATDNYIPVVEHHAHPRYDSKRNLNDVGVLITSAPIPRPATPINRTKISASDVGRAVRIVGFGQTSGSDANSLGRRMEGATTIAAYDSSSLTISGTPNICLFDSGGPTFMNQNGVDVVVGIHFIIDAASCDQNGYDDRVDVYTDFIDGYVEAADPPDAGAADAADDGGAGPPAAASSSGCAVGRWGGAGGEPRDLLAALALIPCIFRRRRSSSPGARSRDARG